MTTARTGKISGNLMVACPYRQSRIFLPPSPVPCAPWKWVQSWNFFCWSKWRKEVFAGMTRPGLYKTEPKFT